MKTWGTELVADLGYCDLASIKNPEHIKAFASYLVAQIDMVAFGEPIVVHFGSEDKMGYTLVQLIETSNITAHFSEDTCSAFVNVFSCKPFETNVVLDVLQAFFNPRFIKHTMHDRISYTH